MTVCRDGSTKIMILPLATGDGYNGSVSICGGHFVSISDCDSSVLEVVMT